VGIGLRVAHYAELLAGPAPVECAEVVTENFLGRGGRPRAVLEQVRSRAAVFLHGVSLSIGGVDPLDGEYLRALRQLALDTEPEWVSDHLCFSRYGGHHAHDLWPLPRTEEAIRHVCERVERVQEVLGRRIALENVSSYVQYRADELTEWEFLREVLERADTCCLLDVNNVYVNSQNHGFDPFEYLAAIPADRIAYVHLAGHRDEGSFLLDDHGGAVAEPVWELYRALIARTGAKPTIIEWDERLPKLERLVAEAARARAEQRSALRLFGPARTTLAASESLAVGVTP
jgi:uncharacterized protein (UPF0276 family)